MPVTRPQSVVSVLALLLVGLGCAASQPKQGLMRAEELLGGVERVYVECELSNARAREALSSLESLVAGRFDGDGTQAYLDLVEAVERSSVQAAVLHEVAEPLAPAAQAYFERWQAGLGTITSASLRERSEARMTQARARYEAVQAALQPALEAYDALDAGLHDHVAFLANDLSSGAFAELASDVDRLGELAADLDRRLDACLYASHEYLAAAALPERPDPEAAASAGLGR